MKGSFLIVGYPRSRTAWLANFLTQGNIACGHEMLSECTLPRHLAGHIRSLGKFYCGSAETAAPLFMPAIVESMPDAKIVFVKRPAADVSASLQRLGMDWQTSWADEGLEYAMKLPQTLVVRYEDLDRMKVLQSIQQWVAPHELFDVRRFQMLRDFNVQITPARWEKLRRMAEVIFKAA